jgi:hypothetical protein
MVNACSARFSSRKFFILCLFRTNLSVNSDYFLKQRELVDICNGEVCCFLCGTDRILKCHSDDLRLQRVKITCQG